jgi:transcriptional regulator with XRE-family HTH domain
MDSETLEVRARVLGVLLREARETAGRSTRDLAQALGCSEERVTAYEFGDKSPTLPELELAALYLQVSLSRFFDERSFGTVRNRVNDPHGVVAARNGLIGALLQQARMDADKSLEEVSSAVGITADLLRKYEFGDRRVPVPLLEALASELGVGMQYFRDSAPEELATWGLPQEHLEEFLALPEELRRFVTSPLNRGYLEVVQHLSDLPAERLRAIAEALLDITY